MKKLDKLLAHRAEIEGIVKEQSLCEHLLNVSNISAQTGMQIGIGNISKTIGLLHDLGKYSVMFQEYLRGVHRQKVNHSSAGALIVKDLATKAMGDIPEIDRLKESWIIYKETLQYVILAHHGLYDIIDQNLKYHTGVRLRYDQDGKYDFQGQGLRFFDSLDQEYKAANGEGIQATYIKGFEEFLQVEAKLKKLARLGSDDRQIQKKTRHYYYGALTRLLLAILKEADIYDSTNYFHDIKDKVYSGEELDGIWQSMHQRVEALYQTYNQAPNPSVLDQTKTKLAHEAQVFAQNHAQGAYQLDMPVGSGKTNAGLLYTTTAATQHAASRAVYATAFLSVLEQNAADMKEVLGADNQEYITEHHSNIISEQEEEFDNESLEDSREYQINEYLKETWESPFILTTLVQLSNTLFKGKAANFRRFSKLINAVIVVDEIQSLPTKAIYNFNLMTNFLTHIMNCTVLHCTATQPNLNNKNVLKYPCIYGAVDKVADNNLCKYKDGSIIKTIPNPEVFHRVDYYSLLGDSETLDASELVTHIKGEMKTEMSTLVVLNTKGSVAEVYRALVDDVEQGGDDWEIIYLTTNQCPYHRLKMIKHMKERLSDIRAGKAQKKIVCVCTKLVEAGINLDFDLAYRTVAGMDSAEQVGGRVNRSGRKEAKGKVFIFEYRAENLGTLVDIRDAKTASKSVLRIHGDNLCEGEKINMKMACDLYFTKLYENYNANKAGDHLEFKVEPNETILNLLSTNAHKASAYENGKEDESFILKQGFATAAREFDLIKEDSRSVIVQYENEDLLEELYQAIENEKYDKIKKLLRKLQPYTIEIRKVEGDERYLRKELDGAILILETGCYDKKIGLNVEGLPLLSF